MKHYFSGVALGIAMIAVIHFGGCSYRNVDDVKANAQRVWTAQGFEIVGYEGYQIGDLLGSPGGKVWYLVRRTGDNRTIYNGYISKWHNEYHIYGLRAMDALKGN